MLPKSSVGISKTKAMALCASLRKVPAGEDFSFSVSSDDLIRQVQEYANDFDISEPIAMWLEARGRVFGVPDAVTLVNDAKEIQAMLDALAEKLGEL